MAEQKIALAGSERAPIPDATPMGPVDPNQVIQVSIVLKQRRALDLDALQGKILSHDEFAAAYGAEPRQIERVAQFARANNLQVVDTPDQIARRTVVVQGTVADLENAFSVKLDDYEHADGVCRGRTGAIHIPADMADIIQGVFGLDNRPQAKPHFRIRTQTLAAAASSTSYSPVQVAKLYSFPTGVTGAGQTIGIIELGGGFNQSDLTTYFESLNLAPPTVTTVSVDGGTNSPTTPDSADAEVLLDVEIAGSVAPGANIVVLLRRQHSAGVPRRTEHCYP